MIETRSGTFVEFAAAADLLARQAPFRLRIVSGSMRPALRPGDWVDFEAAPWENLHPGDIVIVRLDDNLLCHRLRRRYEEGGRRWAVTRGDAVGSEDDPVPAGRVLGRVVRAHRPPRWNVLLWRARFGAAAWRARRRGRLSWRMGFVRRLFRAARALEYFSLAFVKASDVLEATRRFYRRPEQIGYLRDAVRRGLTPEENSLVKRFAPKPGSALLLACGAGREAIALARDGWRVAGIDQEPELLALAQEEASSFGVEAEWICRDISQGFSLGRRFDLIGLFSLGYSLIPARSLRVRLLSACRDHLSPQGRCLISFHWEPGARPSPRLLRAQAWRKRLAAWLGGNREVELGDRWHGGQAFEHQFYSLEEAAQEAKEAGLAFHRDEEMAKGFALLTLPE